MASFFRRRKSLIFKLVIGIPALWFFIVLVLTYQDRTSDSLSLKDRFIPIFSKRDVAKKQDDLNVLPHKDGDVLIKGGRKGKIMDRNNDAENVDHKEVNVQNDAVNNRGNDNALKFKPTQRADFDPNAPGEDGKAVTIDKDKLSPEERKKFDDGWQNNAFNQYASDTISLHRSLPDVRDSECKTEKYKDNLPDTSVVICFHNEAWTVLLRTVHSVLDRSPPHLIREIILVDDFSDMDHLKQPLEDYVAKLKKVKVVHAKERIGLIRARILGYSVAVGDVVTFLDSHCECTEGWLEPLLDRIATNKSNVVCPVIDVIEDDSFKYQYGNARSTSIGGFDWNLQFNWHAIPEYERQRRNNKDHLPVRTPTMAGGLFSISRQYFSEIGTYDPGMDIWGGENLELSFRVKDMVQRPVFKCQASLHQLGPNENYTYKMSDIECVITLIEQVWMCGGILEIIPCSHVGHIFRKRSPYKWRTGVNVVKKNSVRLAEVWMDDYKKYYYERFNFDLGEYGDVTERRKLRENLKCNSFDWFVKNVYPDLFIPGEAVASGEIRNKAKPMCVDSSVDSNNFHKPVNMWPCHNQGGNQFWMLSKSGEIRRDDGCLDFSGGESVIIYPCHGQRGNQEWQYREDSTLVHLNTNKCMETSVDGQKLLMKPCTGVDRQIWKWQRKSSSK